MTIKYNYIFTLLFLATKIKSDFFLVTGEREDFDIFGYSFCFFLRFSATLAAARRRFKSCIDHFFFGFFCIGKEPYGVAPRKRVFLLFFLFPASLFYWFRRFLEKSWGWTQPGRSSSKFFCPASLINWYFPLYVCNVVLGRRKNSIFSLKNNFCKRVVCPLAYVASFLSFDHICTRLDAIWVKNPALDFI